MLNFCLSKPKKEVTFNGAAEQHIKERIEVLCSKSKLSAKEATYLFTNNYKFC